MRALQWILLGLLAVVAFASSDGFGRVTDDVSAPVARDAVLDTARLDGVDARRDADVDPQPGAGTFRRVRVERTDRGIRCPDGRCLPPLNGVAPHDPIPPIEREAFMPPIGEVVGLYTDAEGFDWWITADGSAFTTRWVTVRSADGERRRMVRLDQSDALADVGLAVPFGR